MEALLPAKDELVSPNDRNWVVYAKDALGYPRIVKEHLCDSDSFIELQALRQAGARCWREEHRGLD